MKSNDVTGCPVKRRNVTKCLETHSWTQSIRWVRLTMICVSQIVTTTPGQRLILALLVLLNIVMGAIGLMVITGNLG